MKKIFPLALKGLSIIHALALALILLPKARAEGEEAASQSLSSKVSFFAAIEGGGGEGFGLQKNSAPSTDECRPENVTKESLRAAALSESLFSLYDLSFEGGSHIVPIESGGSLKLRFIIHNNTDYTLLVERLSFAAQGKSGGAYTIHAKTLAANYCGLPFLYAAAPKDIAPYSQFSGNPLENLTLHLDGFPLDFDPPPHYSLELVFMGRFIPQDGGDQIPFVKKIYFSPEILSSGD